MMTVQNTVSAHDWGYYCCNYHHPAASAISPGARLTLWVEPTPPAVGGPLLSQKAPERADL